MNKNSFSYLLRLGFGESWDFFLTKMNGCHTKFLLSSDIYKTYFSRTQMIILCPRYNLLKKLISLFLISFRSSFLDPHFHIFLSLRLANEKKTSIIISLWYLKEKTRYNSITPTITIYYYSQSSFVEEYLLKIVKKLQEEENQKVINEIHHSIWKQNEQIWKLLC